MKRALLPLTLIASLLAPASAFAIDRIGWSETRETMYIHGTIEAGDADIIANAIKSNHRRLRGIILNSSGGSVAEGAKLTDLVVGYSFDTGVTKGGVCASACFMLWAAGKNRYVYPDSTVAIHSAGEKTADINVSKETAVSMSITLAMARAYHELNVPYYLIGIMVTTPNVEHYTLTPQDYANMHARYMQ